VNVTVTDGVAIADLAAIDALTTGTVTAANLTDTAANLVPGGVASVYIGNGSNVTVTGTATMAQLTTIDAANGAGTLAYTAIGDTGSNLAANAGGYVTGAVNVTVTGIGATISQLTTIDSLTTGTLTYTTTNDTAANLVANAGGYLTGAINARVIGAATIVQLSTIDGYTNGTLTYTAIADNQAALIFNTGGYVTGSVNVTVTDTATIAQLTTIASYTTGTITYNAIIDNVPNLIADVATNDGAGTYVKSGHDVTVNDTIATIAQLTAIDTANGAAAVFYNTITDSAANLAANVGGYLKIDTHVNVTGTALAADLITIDGITNQQVNATAVTEITGTAAQILAVRTAWMSGTISLWSNENITVTDGTTVASNDLRDIDYMTNGTVTLLGTAGNDTMNWESYTNGNGLTINGLAGNDTITGTNSPDTLTGDEGSDTLSGYYGPDTINLSEVTAASDTVVLKDSNIDGDDITTIEDIFSRVDIISGFDVQHGAANDTLNLPSNTIAANTGGFVDGTDSGTLKSHSITGGIITFYDDDTAGSAVTIDSSLVSDALTYLGNNIHDFGETVALGYDSDNGGTADSLIVYQASGDNGGEHIVARLNNVTGVTLGTSPANNVVQLVDTTKPSENDVSFTSGVNASITLSYSENVIFTPTEGSTYATLYKNGTDAITITGGSADGHDFTMTTNATLAPTDWLLVRSGDVIHDASGNYTEPGPYFAIGGSGDNTINMMNFASNFPTGVLDVIIGFAGNDNLTGSTLADEIEGGEGSDIIRGYYAADEIGLSEETPASDTVVLKWGESGIGYMDEIEDFYVSGALGANNDKLDLPSNTIAANTVGFVNGTDNGTLKSHSITSGIVTFGDADGGGNTVEITNANLYNALNYLAANFDSYGKTVAFEYDRYNSGDADSLIVFQGGQYDIVAQLDDVTGVTLGTSAASNVVQLVDTTAPIAYSMYYTTSEDASITVTFSENVAYDAGGVDPVFYKNGTDLMTLTGFSADGTNNIQTLSTNDTLAPTDWLLATGGSVTKDASGNYTTAGLHTAVGNDAANTMNLSSFESSGVTIHGRGGNDIITSSAGADTIYGGTGADTITISTVAGMHSTIGVATGDSGPGQGNYDIVSGFETTTAANNDKLDLPSLTIKADGTINIDDITVDLDGAGGMDSVTIGKVNFHDGIATFTLDNDTPVAINSSNATSAAVQALMVNSTIANGETVAVAFSNNGGGTMVFQGGDTAATDILVILAGTTGVTALDTLYVDHAVTIA